MKRNDLKNNEISSRVVSFDFIYDFGGRLDEFYSTASGRRAADRMEYVIDHMGSLEVRDRLVEWVREMARSEKMKCIRETYGYCTLFR